jgi:hypothetical protein
VKLPNPRRAVVDPAKLNEYCLNPLHLRGRHKARVFASVLGITQNNAEILRISLLNAAVQKEAIPTHRDVYGQRYMLDFNLQGPLGNAGIRSTWIVLVAEDFPRLTSCYVL